MPSVIQYVMLYKNLIRHPVSTQIIYASLIYSVEFMYARSVTINECIRKDRFLICLDNGLRTKEYFIHGAFQRVQRIFTKIFKKLFGYTGHLKSFTHNNVEESPVQ